VAVPAKKPHSRDLVSAVLFLKLSAAEKLVLMAICWHYPQAFPSVARIAAMSSQSERWVRHCLRRLQKKGLIEVYYRRDGYAQETSYYTINSDRILMQAGKRSKTTLQAGGSEFRGGGNSVPAGGEEVSTPKQSALDKDKNKSKIERKNLANNRNEQPLQERELANKEDRNSHKDSRILTDPPIVEIKSLQVEVVDSKSNESTHPHPPISAVPPSPSLAKRAKQFPPEVIIPEESFKAALALSLHPGEKDLEDLFNRWCVPCREFGFRETLLAFDYFLCRYSAEAAKAGRPISNFLELGDGVWDLINEMHRAAYGGGHNPPDESKSDRPPFDIESDEWRCLSADVKWMKLGNFYHMAADRAFKRLVKRKQLADEKEARLEFVNNTDLWPTAEDVRAEKIRLAEMQEWDALWAKKRTA
jgi:predicted transcriptional regulator